MTINKSVVEHIASLAKIHLDPESIENYTKDLTEILELVKKMESAPTDNVEPLAHPQEIDLRLRPDQVTPGSARDHIQSIAPSAEGGLYLVPKIIE
mgnify:CR=1 FL=1|tara:strand:+ start:458 stop:745 length:288 start_codon:yes stop_codon:yes gene_type:complete